MTEYPNPVSKQSLEKILDQMNNPLYKIKGNEEILGICLFFYINCENKNIPVMLTNYDIILERYIANNNNIEVSINGKFKRIEFEKVKYFNRAHGFSILEINKKECNGINFLELNEKDCEIDYKKEEVYILCNNNDNNENISVSFGLISYINNDEILISSCLNIINQCWPIYSLSNNKLIGIYKNSSKYYNKGVLLKKIINEFISEYKYAKKEPKFDKNICNEIEIMVKVYEKDIDKKIYFLDNYEYEDNEGKEHHHDNLKELNEVNTEIYINNIKSEYKKYFIPSKEEEYNIKLKISINMTDCSYMFAGCKRIRNINFVSFNTKYITNMKYMFHKCNYLKKLTNLFLFNTKNVIDMTDVFSFCSSLNHLDLSSFNHKNVTDISYMFYNCINLKVLNMPFLNLNYIDNADYVFEICPKLDEAYFNSKNKNTINKYENEIEILVKIKKGDINKDIYFLDNYNSRHDNLKKLNELNTDLYINDVRYEFQKYFKPKKEGEYIIKLKIKINLTNCSYMFAECENIINIKFIRFNIKYVTNIKYMFYRCTNIKNINFSAFNTKNVIDMSNLFHGCKNLLNLDLSSFDTLKVTTMDEMFYDCYNLHNLNISSFNTENVIYMTEMFMFCENLKTLDLSHFNTINVKSMIGMFANCYNLDYLNLSSFNTANVRYANKIFLSCKQDIIDANISKFKKFKYDDLINF